MARASGLRSAGKRQRSDVGAELRAVKNEKYTAFKLTGTWPWHARFHPSEAIHFSPKVFIEDGAVNNGGGYSGVAWRLTRHWYITNGHEAALAAYEQPWIEQYGDLAHDRALRWSQQFLDKALENGHTAQDVLGNPHIAKIYEDMADSRSLYIDDWN